MARGTEANMKEEDDFGEQENWEDEEFDERVSHASSRINDSSYVPNQMIEDRGQDQDYQYQGYSGAKDNQEYYEQDQSNSEIEQIVEETYEEVGEIHDPESKKDFQAAYEQLVEKVSHDQNHRDLLLSDQEYNNMQRKKIIKGTNRTDQRVQDFQERK